MKQRLFVCTLTSIKDFKSMLLFAFLMFLSNSLFSATYTWNGSVSSAWNLNANWTPSTGFPVAGDIVNINSGAVPNLCVLNTNRSIATLNLSAGTINLNGFTLTLSTSFNATGGFLNNGIINVTNITALSNTTFNGSVTLIKSGGGDNLLSGGNTFNGPFTLTNSDNNYILMANSAGDAFNNTLIVNVNDAGRVFIAHNGANTFSNNITLNCSNSGGVEFGGSSGTSTQSSGAILTSGFTNGSFVLNRFTQSTSSSNGFFNPTSFSCINTSLNGNFSITTSAGDITINNSSFTATNTFTSAGNISLSNTCAFSSVSGTTDFVKNGGDDNNWNGTFSIGNWTITNNDNNYIAFGNSTGSIFTISGTSVFNVNSSGRLYINHTGNASFGNTITLNCTGTGGAEVGGAGGTSTQSSGNFTTTGFSNGSLIVNRLTQSSSSSNGSFNPTTFTSSNSTFLGDFSIITSSGDITITNGTFTGASTFNSAGGITATGTCNFSTTSGNAVFVKNGGGDNNWTGTFAFGPVSVTNNVNSYLALCNSAGSIFTYNASSSFTNTSTGRFYISHQGSSTFAGNVTASNSGTGGMEFGGAGGTSAQSTGSFLTSGFTNGSFIFNNFTQAIASSNGSFNPTTFTSSNSTLLGDFSIITSSGDITITNGTFTGASTFNSAGGITATGTCNFSTTSGNAVFVKNGGGDNNWTGTFAFGPVSVTNNVNSYLALCNSAGSIFTYNSSSSFTNTSSGRFYVSHQGSSTFAGNVTASNSGTGGMEFGGAGGTSAQSSGSFLTSGFTNGSFIFNNFTQAIASSNGSFNPTSFTSNNCTLLGDFSIVTSAGDITITNGTFTGASTFNSAGGITATGTCNFSTTSGNAVFVKNGGGDNNWTGTFAFGPVSVTNNVNSYLALCNSPGSIFTYNASSSFTNTSTGRFYISHQGSSTFAGNVTASNSGTGGMEFGGAGGTSAQSTGSFLTTGFTNGSFILNNFTQSIASSNGSFNPTTFSTSNSTLLGNFAVVTSSGDLSITSCNFVAGNTFTSAGNLNVINANNFSTTSGTSTFQKNGGGDNIWTGGNTFGNVVVINNDNNFILMANTSPDDFNGSATFRQLSSGILYPAHNGNNTFSGNISTTGTLTAITFGAGTGRVIIDGSSTQTFTGSATLIPVVRRLTMATSGTGNLTLAVPVNTTINLTLTTGLIHTTTANTLTLTDETTTTTVGNSSSYVNGPMQYTMTTNSGTRSTLNFPVGKAADWRPVILQVAHSTNTSYTYRAEVFNASARALGYTLPATVDTVSNVHYWDIDRYLTSTMASSSSTDLRVAAGDRPIVTLYFGTNDAVYQGANLTIVKNTVAAPTTWFNIGGSSTAGPSGTPVSGTVVSTSSPTVFNSFSRFTLGSRLVGWNPLPIELTSFEATCKNNSVHLDWETASETNNDYFTLEKSLDGINYEAIATVQGAGNTNEPQAYNYYHDNASGAAYYRLKQTDFDGQYTYFNPVFAHCNSVETAVATIYPNPGTNAFVLELNQDNGELQFDVINSTGAIVYSGTFTQKTTLATTELSPGLYYVRLSNGSMLKWLKTE